MTTDEYTDLLKRTLRAACGMLNDTSRGVGGAPVFGSFVNDALDVLSDDPRNGRAERAERTTDPAPAFETEEYGSAPGVVLDSGVLRVLPFVAGGEETGR